MLSAQNLHHYVNKYYSACAVSVRHVGPAGIFLFSSSVTAEGRLNKSILKCVKCVGEAIGNKQFFHSVPLLFVKANHKSG